MPLHALAARLAALDRPGAFSASGALRCPMPPLRVDGVGPVALPLLAVQAQQLLAVSTPAPYGRGADTLVDAGVRRAAQIGPERVTIDDPAWADTLTTIVAEATRQLGAGSATAELYKLLIYEPGGFFVPHRDTEKVDGMFATLVVALPSAHEGGALVVRHGGEEVRLDLRNDNLSRVTYAAFYADCVHELEPITAGYRLVLVYNLVRRGATVRPPEHGAAIREVTTILRRWAASDEAPVKALCTLAHRYTPAALSFAGLKNGDAAMAHVLTAAANAADCELHLAMISVEESGTAEPVYGGRGYGRRERRDADEFEIIEVLDRVEQIVGWVRPDDEPADLPSLPWTAAEVVPAGALDDVQPDEETFTEATGNEGGSFERSYRTAALILWPRRRRLDMAAQAGPTFAVAILDDLSDDDARELAHQLVVGWPTGADDRPRAGVAGRLLAALARLAELEDAERFVDDVLLPQGFHAADAPGLVACGQAFAAEGFTRHLADLLAIHVEPRTPACAALLDRATATPDLDARPIAEAALRHLPRDVAAPMWPTAVPVDVVTTLLAAFARVEPTGSDPSLLDRATRHLLDHPGRYPIEAVLIPAALQLGRTVPTLRDHLRTWLDARIAEPLAPPSDWTRAADVGCTCTDCASFARFLADPVARTWSVAAAERQRRHIEGRVRGCDVDLETIREGSPYTLRATKNQRSYERRVTERASDLTLRKKLAG